MTTYTLRSTARKVAETHIAPIRSDVFAEEWHKKSTDSTMLKKVRSPKNTCAPNEANVIELQPARKGEWGISPILRA